MAVEITVRYHCFHCDSQNKEIDMELDYPPPRDGSSGIEEIKELKCPECKKPMTPWHIWVTRVFI